MNVLGDWVLEQMRDAEVRALVKMGATRCKALWDEYDGCNVPQGYSGENIHMALNILGHGEYCAV